MIYVAMLEEIKKWSREDWQLFDSYRAIAFQPTQEEIENQHQQYINNIVLKTQWYLALYGIKLTGNEVDFTKLYTLYIKWWKSENNKDMKEWIGEALDETLQYRIENHNNIQDFCQFILSYE